MHADGQEASAPSVGEVEARQTARLRLGRRLFQLRSSKELSLREAAGRAGLSSGFISLVERGKTSIAVARLARLADAYGVEVAELLAAEETETAELKFVKLAAASRLESDEPGVEVLYIPAPPWIAQPFIVHLEAGARLQKLQHRGYEFIHCASGAPTITVGEDAYELSVGDTVFIDSETPHEYANESADPATLFGASMPRR